MAEEISAPFSARNRGAHAQIDNDCPATTRVGLIHILHRAIEERYVEGWKAIVAELQRIARVIPDHSDYPQAAEVVLLDLSWEKVFDFCERLHSYLSQDVSQYDGYTQEKEIVRSRSSVQEYIAGELQRLFLEEHLAFEFSDGLVRRRGRRNTAEQISRAELVLGDPRLSAARGNFNKALRYFRNVSEPDYENVVKEAVCSIEAAARALFPDRGSTLGEVVKSITGTAAGELPKAIANTFHGLYGFGNGAEGVRHGGATGCTVTKELAEYALAVAASQIVLLVDLAAEADKVPF